MMVRVLRVLTRSFRGGFVFWVLGLVGKGHFFYGEGVESPHKKFWGWLCWICFKSIGRPAGRPAGRPTFYGMQIPKK